MQPEQPHPPTEAQSHNNLNRDDDRDAADHKDDSAKNPLISHVTVIGNKNPVHYAERRREKPHFITWLGLLVAAIAAGIYAYQSVIFNQQLGAMQTQLAVAREQLVTSSRAFVYFRNSYNVGQREDGQTIGIAPIWGNSGNTSTLHLSVTTYCFSPSETPLVDPFEAPNPAGQHTEANVLGPKVDNFISSTCLLPRNTIEGINSGRLHYYLAGRADYSDIITKTEQWVTEFAVQITYMNPSNLAVIRGGTTGRHNCADSDCPK